MKKILKLSAVFIPMLLTGCKDDITPYNPMIGYEEGDVVFNIANGPTTRTMYQDAWDETTNQSIYWGNYIANDPDQIKIFCKVAMQSQICTYKVNPAASGADQSVAGSIEKISANAMKWGDERATHNFYAFYPAQMAGDAFVGDSDCIINATVENGQSPVSYKGVTRDGTTLTTLQQIAENANTASEMGTSDVKTKQTTIYGLPDMQAAIMMAAKSMDPSHYGEDVPLEFNVMADVLDITVNGPVKPNSLGGNASADQQGKERNFIKIQDVIITAPENVSLAGSFNLDMSKTGSECVVPGSIVSGTNVIQLQTAEDGQYPTLHVRCDPGGEDAKPSMDQIDHLRLRAFLIPGQVTDLSQLKITIQTDCGDYEQQLGTSAIVSGAIHPINLGFFRQAGAQFNFAKWVGQLNDDIYLSELSIPGAWHSTNAAYQGDISGDLQAQYNKGIRAFEVHSTNGTTLYTDQNFKTSFSVDNPDNADWDNATRQDENVVTNEDDPQYDNINYDRVSLGNFKVTATNVRLTQRKTTTYNVVPKYALRLYRTQNITETNPNPSESMSDAIIKLAKNMNKDGIMFLEFGMNKQRDVTIPIRSYTVIETRSQVLAELTGSASYRNGPVTWNSVNWDGIEWTQSGDPSYTSTSTTVKGSQAWVVAVQTCLDRLKGTDSPNGCGKPIVYPYEISSETTLGEVRGECIVKVNTNGDSGDNANETGWTPNTPALFSRWVDKSGNTPITINLQWGNPIAPGTTDAPTSALHWCFTELDNIKDYGSSLENRQKAIDTFLDKSWTNYKDGLHRTFYECMIGGYTGGGNPTATGCQEAAVSLNNYLLSKLTSPSRKASPLGLVFMNYVGGTTYNSKDANSAELIRVIINNNRAFLLNRKPKGNVGDNTNSNFQNNPNNPLKD